MSNWFQLENQDGKRDVNHSKIGLDYIIDKVENKTVIDLGCAEGLISHWLLKEGKAKSVHGYEMSKVRVDNAKQIFSGENKDSYYFENINVDNLDKSKLKLKEYDVVLALAITHLLNDKNKFINFIQNISKEYIIFRTKESLCKELGVPYIFKDYEVVHNVESDLPFIGPLWILKKI